MFWNVSVTLTSVQFLPHFIKVGFISGNTHCQLRLCREPDPNYMPSHPIHTNPLITSLPASQHDHLPSLCEFPCHGHGIKLDFN